MSIKTFLKEKNRQHMKIKQESNNFKMLLYQGIRYKILC